MKTVRTGIVLLGMKFIAAAWMLVASTLIMGCERQTRPDIPTIERVDTHVAAANRAGLDVELDGEPAPYFALTTLEGGTLTLEDLEGHVVVLNFWATWCAPCLVEIPDLIEMQAELEDRGVRFVGISIDHEGPDVVRAFAEEAEFNYPIVFDDGEVADAYGGVYALPTTILIDREGHVRRKISGLVTKNLLMPLLEALAEA